MVRNELGGLELGLFGNLFGKKTSDTSNQIENISRREFMNTTGKAIALTAVKTSALGGAINFLSSENAYASSTLPPGIVHAKDGSKAQLLWGLYNNTNLDRIFREHTNVELAKRLLRGEGFNMSGKRLKITNWTEPAIYFTAAKEGDFNDTLDNLNKQDKSLRYLALGFRDYFYTWKFGNKRTQSTEEYFMKSLLLLVDRPENDYRGYKEMNDSQKETFFNNLVKLVKNKEEITKSQFSWASFMLVNHYDKLKNKKMGDLTYQILEVKSAKLLGHPIRGPPHYYI